MVTGEDQFVLRNKFKGELLDAKFPMSHIYETE